MYNFNFQSASSLDDAAAKLAAAEDGTVIAGGQTLLPVLKQRLANPSDVVDLSGIADLKGIKAGADSVTIGAMVTHAEVAGSSDVPAALRAVAEGIGDPQVRNRGTLGGSVANNDPAADYPAALLGLGALGPFTCWALFGPFKKVYLKINMFECFLENTRTSGRKLAF